MSAQTAVSTADFLSPSAKADEKKREVVRQGFEKKGGFEKCVAEQLEAGVWRVACPNGEALAEGSSNYKEYKNQYKRISTHLRQNASLLVRLKSGELPALDMASMADKDLMAESQLEDIKRFKEEGKKEALGISSEDTAHWTPTKSFNCPLCESDATLYIQTFKGGHGYDDNNIEPAITIRCRACRHLWKEDEVDGGRLAGGSEGGAVAKENWRLPTAERPEMWREADTKESWLLPP